MNLKRRLSQRFLIAGALLIASACLCPSAHAQDRREAVPKNDLINDLAASHPASAYIDESTLVVAEIDWEKFDAEAFFKMAQKLTGDRPSDTPLVERLFANLKMADAGKIYLLAGLQTLGDGVPLIVIPTPDSKRLLKSIEEVLGKVPPSVQVDAAATALVIGPPGQIKRTADVASVKRDAILLPLRDANRLDHTVVLAVPETMRDMLGKIWPRSAQDGFPESVSPSALVRDINRIVFTFRTPPNSLARLAIESVDSQAADRVTKAFSDLKGRYAETLDGVTILRGEKQISLEADQAFFDRLASLASRARDADRESELVNTLKSLGLAFYNYADREKHFPPRCFVDPDGKPLHSWLVAVLPDFNQIAFYRSLKLDRPWDDSANARLRNTTPRGIGDERLPVAHTTIRAPVFPGSLWHGDGPPKRRKEITDGTANTILLIDAPVDASIHWADPTPWVISQDDPMKDVFGDRDQTHVLLADGAVLLLRRSDLDNKKLKAMLTFADGD